MMSVQLQMLGGALEVGANCLGLHDGRRAVWLDCGLHPKREGKEALPDFDAWQGPAPSSLLLTHCHHDHLGGVPVALKRQPGMRCLMSEASRLIAPTMLRNAAQLMKRRALAGDGREPLYDFAWLDECWRRMVGLELETRFTLHGQIPRGTRSPTFRLQPAGHILGACGVDFDWDGLRIFCTGDLSVLDQGLVPGCDFPRHCDVLIMESTLGATPEMDAWDRETEAERLAAACRAVLLAGGSVIIPAFALGRTQEMLFLLDDFRRRGAIPPCPIYFGGLGRAINEVYDAARFLAPRLHPGFVLDRMEATVLPPALLEAEDPFEKPSIFVMTSGMVQRDTPSFRLVQRALERPEQAVFFVGYCDWEADGYPVWAARTGNTIRWRGHAGPVEVKCRLDHFRFSGHARRTDLVALTESMQPAHVVLVHGSPAALESLQSTLRERLPAAQVDIAWPRRPMVLGRTGMAS
jgi:Cft2 family RNA processing exonuclease